MIRTEIISDLAEFENLRETWNGVIERSDHQSVFGTWEWLISWWRTFGNDQVLFIIIARDASGELLAIAPLYIKRRILYGFPVRELTFIGTPHSDRNDFLICGDYKKIMPLISGIIRENRSMWDLIHLEQVPEDSNLAILALFHPLIGKVEESSTCPYIEINSDWDGYHKSLGRNLRRDLTKKWNRLNRQGALSFHTTNDYSEIIHYLDTLKEIEMKSGKYNTPRAFLTKEDNHNFMKNLFETESDFFAIDLSLILFNKKAIAYLIGFTHKDKYFAYNTAYDYEFFSGSPGKQLFYEKIKWCFENHDRYREFDFLRGDTHWKSFWTTTCKNNLRLVIFKNSPYSLFLMLLSLKIRPFVKKFMRKKQ